MSVSNSGVRISVLEEGESLLDLSLEEPRFLFGSGSHCDVQLGPELLATEQLFAEVRDGELYVDVLATDPAVTVGGVEFSGGRLEGDAQLAVGDLRVQIRIEVREGKGDDSGLDKRFVALLLVVAIGATFGLAKLRNSQTGPEKVGPPALFAREQAAQCPEANPDAALLAAEELLLEAHTRHERVFFQIADVAPAARAYDGAVACLKAGGKSKMAQEVSETAERFKRDAERAYHLRQVRLHRAQAFGNDEMVRAEVDALAEYLADRDDPYVAKLDRLRRHLHATKEVENAK